MSLKVLLSGELTHCFRLRIPILKRAFATTSDSSKEEIFDLTSVDAHPKYREEVVEEDEIKLEKQRNKSRLNNSDYNILNGRRPYEDEGPAMHHRTLQWKRKMLGRFGIEGSGVPPGVAWPTKEDITSTKEYEKVAYPLTLQDSWAKLKSDREAEEAAIQARQDDIAAKLAKTGQWEKELNAKIAKKEAAVRIAKEHKERLVEEVRRHFGFKIDPRDERFKTMLEEKEKEDKLRQKAAKKKERQEKAIAKLLKESKITTSEANADDRSKSSTLKDLA